VFTFRRRRSGLVSHTSTSLASVDVTAVGVSSLAGIPHWGGGIPRGTRMLELAGLTWLLSVRLARGNWLGRHAVLLSAVCAGLNRGLVAVG